MNHPPPHAPHLELSRVPERVVSLLPSMTQSLIDLGAADRLVAVTDYCPVDTLEIDRIVQVGGPKNPDVNAIVSLQPDLVLANREENTPATVQALREAAIPVWVTFPRSTLESMDVLWALIGVLRLDTLASSRLHALQKTLDWALTARQSDGLLRTFCPIWQGATADGTPWWMTFNQDTYAHDVLACCGGENIFADRERRYPLEADLGRASPEEAGDRDRRYPRVTADEIIQLEPEVILLPDEPFHFTPSSQEEISRLLAGTPAVENQRIYLVEGALLTWHGTYLARALAELPAYFSSP